MTRAALGLLLALASSACDGERSTAPSTAVTVFGPEAGGLSASPSALTESTLTSASASTMMPVPRGWPHRLAILRQFGGLKCFDACPAGVKTDLVVDVSFDTSQSVGAVAGVVTPSGLASGGYDVNCFHRCLKTTKFFFHVAIPIMRLMFTTRAPGFGEVRGAPLTLHDAFGLTSDRMFPSMQIEP